MKTNSNSYTIIYSAVIVVIVAFLLAFVFQALKPMQDANVALDKKKQILNSLKKGRLLRLERKAVKKPVSSLKARIIRQVSWLCISAKSTVLANM